MRFKALAFIFSAICLSVQANAAVMDTEAQVMSAGDAKSIPLSVTFFSIASVSNMTYNKSDKEPSSVTERSFGSYDYISLNRSEEHTSELQSH